MSTSTASYAPVARDVIRDIVRCRGKAPEPTEDELNAMLEPFALVRSKEHAIELAERAIDAWEYGR